MAIQSSENTASNPTSPVSQTTAFADWLRNQSRQDPLETYLDSDGPRATFVENFSLPDNPHNQPTLKSSSLFSSGTANSNSNSMAHSRLNHGPESVISSFAFTPSLVRSGTNTSDGSSVATDLASQLPGMPLLEDTGDGLLERRDAQPDTPTFECTFVFLGCPYTSHDEAEWRTHCLSHWRREEPPRVVSCPLCGDFSGEWASGHEAWDKRQTHMADVHHKRGQGLRLARPDFRLFEHLWRKKLINDAQYKELKGGNHTLSGPWSPFTVTHNLQQEQRRQRRPRNFPDGARRSMR